MAGYWVFDLVGEREWCYAQGSWGPDGLFYLKQGTDVWGCFWVTSFSSRWISVGDPNYDPDWDGADGPGGQTIQWDEQPEPPDVVSLSVAPTSMSVEEGQLGGPFVVTAHYADDTSNEVPGDWSSSNGGVLVPDDVGYLMATGMGQASFVAEFGGKSASSAVTVVPEGMNEYCPNTNPNCIKPLLASQRTKLLAAIAMADTTWQICKDAKSRFLEIMDRGRIYRGNPQVPDKPNDVHHAETRLFFLSGTQIEVPSMTLIHFDHDYLESESVAAVAGLAIHEAWHALGFEHAEAENTHPYITEPFKWQDACVVQ